MKKAAIIAPNSLPVPPIRGGGIQNGIAEIIHHYREYKPYVFSICEAGVDDLPLRESDGNAEHRRIRIPRFRDFMIRLTHLSTRSYFPYVREISGQLKEINPDIIHVRSRPWFLPLLRRDLGNDVKMILHNHNNYFMEMGERQVKKYLSLMDAFAGVSRFTVDAEVLSRFPEEKERCFVIYNGVNPEKFGPKGTDPARVAELRKKYGIKKGDRVIAYLGRLRKSKGVDVLLNAVKSLRMPEVKLLLVGGHFFGGDETISPFMRELKSSAEEMKGSVIFTGFVPRSDIQNVYALTDIVALPSLVQDASPNVCYEAQAMECPIVSTKRGGIPEIVEDGKTALLVDDPEDSKELKEKLKCLLENPGQMKAFGERGRKRMLEGFTWERAARRTEEMYNKVLG